MKEKQEIDDECIECRYYHHSPERQYLSNGDPGYPEENDCDKDWLCPYLDDDDDDDEED